jgi:hypothetical protein
LLAAVLVQQGQHAEALAMVRDGLECRKRPGAVLWDAELHRVEGTALTRCNRAEKAETDFEDALRIAPGKSL